MGLHFYVLLVVTTGNETNEYDIGRGALKRCEMHRKSWSEPQKEKSA